MTDTWIALVGPEIEENLGLRYLAASLSQAGIRSELLAFNTPEDFPRVISAIIEAKPAPLMVGLSLAFQWRAEDMLALAMALRSGGYRGHVTGGGHFGTFAARELLRDFDELDSICRFEAEATIVELARALDSGAPLSSVRGLAVREEGKVVFAPPSALPDLAELPWPDRRGEPARCFDHPMAPLVGSRGCYGRCSFCSISAWHDAASPGKRFRLRDVNDIADEMAELQRVRNIEIFLFEDDNFFLPRMEASLERIHALADALQRRGVSRFATVVKARPDDVRVEIFRPLVERLRCLRAYVGIESHSRSGLETLARNARPVDNERALDVVRQLGLYVCFNLLPFDPDATLESFTENVEFMKTVVDYPLCTARVELYAGTPLLARMQREGRCRGDYLGWDYQLADPRLQRLFRWFMACQRERNFASHGAVHHLWLLRFDVETARLFHPEQFRPAWRERAEELTRSVSADSVAVLEKLIACAARDQDAASVVSALTERARVIDTAAIDGALALAEEMSDSLGVLASLSIAHGARAVRQGSLASS